MDSRAERPEPEYAPDRSIASRGRAGTRFREAAEGAICRIRRVHVIINPASGRNRPILNTLNDLLVPAEIDWDVSITRPAVDIGETVARALESEPDILAVYGGDGTVAGVAAHLSDRPTPLAVLPGGTSNALASALGIPSELADACRLITEGTGCLRRIDMGRTDGGCFLVAVGIGIAGAVAAAEREEKDHFGSLAYLARGLQALGRASSSRYSLELDGESVETRGVACLICNAGSFGLPGLSLAPPVFIDDGLLDVLVLRDVDIGTIISMAAQLLQREDLDAGHGAKSRAPQKGPRVVEGRLRAMERALKHWQVRRVSLVSDPPQAVQLDGQTREPGPVHAEVLPAAISVLVPRPERSASSYPSR